MSLRVHGPCAEPGAAPHPAELERGWSALRTAVELYRLVGDGRGDRLDALLTGHVEAPRPDGLRVAGIAHVKAIVALLDGIEEALAPVVGDELEIRPEALDRVRAWAPSRILTWEEDGGTVHSLNHEVMPVLGVRRFLRQCLAAGCAVELD